MNGSWNIFGIILLLSFFRFQVVRAQALALVVNADKITYVPAGSTLELNVSYTYTGTRTVIVQWNFKGTGIVGKAGNDPPQRSNSRATIRGKASLVLYNTILSDNGTYSISVQPLGEARKESRFQVIIEAQTLRFTSHPTGPTSVEVGKNLTLDVTYEYTGFRGSRVTWLKGTNVLVRKIEDGRVIKFQNRSDVKRQASLVLSSTTLMDNGTYTVRLAANDIRESVETNLIVIIEERPTAKTNCSQFYSAEEGESISCLCSSEGGSPPATASWLKDSGVIGVGYLKKILLLEDINKEDSGTYKCKVRSYSLTDEKAIHIAVTYKPTIISFRSDQKNNIATVGASIEISCKADANPPAKYMISMNGTQLTEVSSGLKTICTANYGDAGRYECLAKNSRGNLSSSFFLNVMADRTKPTTRPFATTEKQTFDESCSGQEWYISVITFACGVCVGMIFLYAIQRLQHRLKNRRDHPKSSQPCSTSATSHERPESFSTYEDLDLRRMPAEDNYQSLSVRSRNAKNVEVDVKDESSYQELDKVRENNDNNYQALNRQ